MAALQKFYLGSDDTGGLNAAVAIYFIFGVFFTTTIECTAYVYGSEIWPTRTLTDISNLLRQDIVTHLSSQTCAARAQPWFLRPSLATL